MSLDLNKTALQVDKMSLELKAQQGNKDLRLQRALQVIGSFDAGRYEDLRQRSEGKFQWNVPGLLDGPAARYPVRPLPTDFCVAGVDGSHVEVDRHVPARCYVINIGVAILTYGTQPDARLTSQPRLYAQEDELVICDPGAPFHHQAIEGAVLGAKRMVEEAKALAQVVRSFPPHIPTLGLMDGSLIMLGLIGRGYNDFVRDNLIREGFILALEELAQIARKRPFAVASYISLPRSIEVLNVLRLACCPYETADCSYYCGARPAGERPCDGAAKGLVDREVFAGLLGPGERSGLFASSSPMVKDYYKGHEVYYFYLQTGEELGRVEVPVWVAENEALLELCHTLVVDQCRRGPGYPTALMEAHEQAVVTGADRQQFTRLVEDALSAEHVPGQPSEKSRSKQLRWV